MTAPTATQLFRIGREDRCIFVGKSRSGKSYGAAFLIKEEIRTKGERFLIIDTKISKVFNEGPWHFITKPEEIDDFYLNPNNRRKSLVYRPDEDIPESQMRAEVEILLRWAYRNGPMTVYIDEAMEVCENATTYPPAVKALATRGGERGVRLWVATQRPMGIPKVLMTEADHFFLFRLTSESDQKRVSEVAEMNLSDTLGKLKKRQFIYISGEEEAVTGPYTFV